MACENRVFGNCQVAFRGRNFDPIEGSTSFDLGGPVFKSPMMTDSARMYAATSNVPAMIEFELPVTADLDLSQFQGACGDVTLLLDTGQRYIFPNGLMGEPVKAKSGEGKTKVVVHSDPAIAFG
jgi:Phage tail tube protein